MLWQYAAWGLAGALINRALVFMEANARSKAKPWRFPEGPGGGYFSLAVVLHAGIGTVVAAAAAASHVIASPLLALGVGATAPILVKKASQYALRALPPGDGDGEDATP